MRPSPVGSSTSAVSTVSTLPADSCASTRAASVAGAQQRRVPVDEQDGPVEVRDGGQRDRGRVPGAELLRLRRPAARRARSRARWCLHRLPARTDDDDGRRGPQRVGRGEHVAEHRAAAEGVQHLRRRRPHPGALPGGEDDDGGDRRPAGDGDVSCGITDLLGRRRHGLRWGTRTRTETARLQRPAGCRLPHPPPAARGGHAGAAARPAPGAEPRADASRRQAPSRPTRPAPPTSVRRRRLRCRRLRGRSPAHDGADRAPGDVPSSRSLFVRSRTDPAHGPAPPRRPERRTPGQRARHGARASLEIVTLYVFVVGAVRGARRRRPGGVGVGPVLARRRPRRRLLLPHAARRDGRLPPVLHARLVQGESARCGSPSPSPARMAIQGPVVQWVADHRRHHAFSDREGDPHSPWRYGNDAERAGQGHVPRPPGLAVRPPADQRGALRPRPARRTAAWSRQPAVRPLGASSASPCPGHRRPRHRRWRAPGRRSSGPVSCGSPCCTTSPGRSTPSATSSATGRSSPRPRPGDELLAAGDPQRRRVVAQPAPRRPDLRPARRAAAARST